MPILTAGEECQIAAKTLSIFADPRQGAITAPFINAAMGIAIFKGDEGVAVVRLPSSEWSAPCAISCESAQGVQPGQDTVILFMTERTIFSLVGQTGMILGKTHRFEPGPMYAGTLSLDPAVDVYAYVRYNNGFTPAELISTYMTGWSFKEDRKRHERWHGRDATWFDVLTNKISVDRSSVGNALYVVLNMGTSGTKGTTGKNYADIEGWSTSLRKNQVSQPNPLQNIPSSSHQRAASLNQIRNDQQQFSDNKQVSSHQNIEANASMESFDAQKMFEMQLLQQEMQQQSLMKSLMMNQGNQQMQGYLGIQPHLQTNQFQQSNMLSNYNASQMMTQFNPQGEGINMMGLNPNPQSMMAISPHMNMMNPQYMNQQLHQMTNEQLLNQMSNPQLIYQGVNMQGNQMNQQNSHSMNNQFSQQNIRPK